MAQPTIYKYKPPFATISSAARGGMWVAGIVGLIITTLTSWEFIFLTVVVVVFVHSFSVERAASLRFYSRYLICGPYIIYFANVTQIRRSPTTLVLTHTAGPAFVVNQTYFTSNARKQEKIRRHQQERFKKVCDRLTSRSKELQPDVKVSETSDWGDTSPPVAR